jgi:hypothetical protein
VTAQEGLGCAVGVGRGQGLRGALVCDDAVGNQRIGILGQTLDELVQAGVVSAGARVNGEVVAFSAIHGVAELAISGAFGRLSEVQLWGQLEQVKRNLLLGLRNEEVLVAPPTRSHVDPQSKRRTLRRALT